MGKKNKPKKKPNSSASDFGDATDPNLQIPNILGNVNQDEPLSITSENERTAKPDSDGTEVETDTKTVIDEGTPAEAINGRPKDTLPEPYQALSTTTGNDEAGILETLVVVNTMTNGSILEFPQDAAAESDVNNEPTVFENEPYMTSSPPNSIAMTIQQYDTSEEQVESVKAEIAFPNAGLDRSTENASPGSVTLSKDVDNSMLRITIEELRSELEQSHEEKLQVEKQYRNLFAKVTQMKTTLGARLKQDAEELAQNRGVIEELELQNHAYNEAIQHMQQQVLLDSQASTSRAIEAQRSLDECSQLKHRITELEASLEAEVLKRTAIEERGLMASAEWDNMAMEERSVRDTLRDRIHDLEEQLSAQNNAYDNLHMIVKQDNAAIVKYKQTLYDLHESHSTQMRALTESMQSTIDELSKDNNALKEDLVLVRLQNTKMTHILETSKVFENEAKEKTLLIGKLRHEAVILNEHLTKALRLLKRGSSTDSVDRHLLNNLLLSFFQLPRQDSKRFEVLKILSSVLNWDDTQKEQAGLLRPGSTTSLVSMTANSVRSPPASPTVNRGMMSRRTSGIVQLQAADFIGPNRESMSDLWINFLQSEAAMNAAEDVEIQPK